VLEVVLMSKVVGPCAYILGLVYTIHTLTFGGRIAAQNFMRGAAVNGDFEGRVDYRDVLCNSPDDLKVAVLLPNL
jgi:hypothetical protein